MSFAVISSGRCATTYLAAQLNRSPTWIVEHEPLKFHWTHPKWGLVDGRIAHNLQQSRYTEIRPRIKGVILRHPLDIYFSSIRRWVHEPRGAAARDWVRNITQMVRVLDQTIRNGEPHIFRFHEITMNVQAIVDGARSLGIDDLDPNTLSTASVNSWKRYDYALDELDPTLVQSVRDDCGWFVDKYELPLECEVVNA